MKFLPFGIVIGILFGGAVKKLDASERKDGKVSLVKNKNQYQTPRHSSNGSVEFNLLDVYRTRTHNNVNFLKISDYFYEESSFKRSEIIFFLSIPFIFLAHAISLGTIHFIATQDVTFTSFPTEAFFFAGASSLMIAGGIIYLDFKKNKGLPKNTQERHRFRLRYSYSF